MASHIGLDIGTSAVRAVELSTRRGVDTIVRLGQVQLPSGAVRDGEVVDAAAVTEAIRTLWGKYGFKGRKVALGVANQQVVVRQVELPYLPEAELRQSLPFQVQEFIPIPVEHASLDCSILEHYENEAGERFSRVLVVAAHREMVDSLLEAVSGAKLEPTLLDLDAFALLRSLASDSVLDDAGGEMIIGIGASVTNIIVHELGVPRFVRVLTMGGNVINEGLAASGELSPEEVEQIKASTGLVTDDFAFDEHARIIKERANKFVDEIRGSLDYYAAQADAIKVRRAVVTGGGSRLRNLDQRLAEVLGIPVEAGHAFQHVGVGKVGLDDAQLAEAQHFLSVAVGLAQGVAR